ncbi:MAG: lipopolysaccharide biosynthesis protein [Ruaniaceae bacterium]|nr:lipopolysaccharide biosynthesis protein [Ruaniaceae bacterium]
MTRTQVTRDYFWNTAASVMSAGSSMILLLVVTQFLGAYVGGIFSLAVALGWQLQPLGSFEMRLYQATDIEHRFTFGAYHASRLTTITLMVLGIIGYSLVTGGVTQEALLVILVAMLRVFDSYEDVFQGEFQRLGRLHIGARACFFRVLTTTVVFTASVALIRDLFMACVLTIVASAAALIALNIPAARRLYGLRPSFDLQPLKRLLLACLPLFVGAFLAMYLTNAPRFGIDRSLPREDQTYYNVLFMPAMMINLLSGLAFKPLLTSLAKNWLMGNLEGFFATIRRGFVAILISTVSMLAIGYFVGIPLLGFLYGIDLEGFLWELMVLIVGGAFSAVSILLYYILVTMRLQKAAMFGYGIAAVAATFLSWILIPKFGMMGACLTFTGAMAILVMFWLIRIVVAFWSYREKRGYSADGLQEL